MVYFNADKFDVEAYLPYPSVVHNRLNEYDDFYSKRGDRHVKQFFEQLREKVKNEQGKDYFDNKVAYRIRHKETGTVLWVGYKDNIWSIGLTAMNMDNPDRIIEFNKK